MKKLISLALVLAMVLSLATVAFAYDSDVTCQITAPYNGHSYAAYQIFVGDLNQGVLSSVVWGNGISAKGQADVGMHYAKASIPEGQQVPADLKPFTASEVAGKLKTESDAEEFAKIVAPYLVPGSAINLTNPDHKVEATDDVAAHYVTAVDPGYYLVKDSAPVTGHDAATDYILHVAGVVALNPKSSVPTIDKTQSTTGAENSFTHDVLDVNISDKVYYEITGTLPNTLSDYETYKYAFHDTLSAGLDYNDGSYKVFIDGTDVTSFFTVEYDSHKLDVSIDDILSIDGVTVTSQSIVKLYYDATLNTSAVIGGDGNPNKVSLEFSNDPTFKGDGTTTPPTGETPEVKVVVFTFQINVDKQDNANQNIHLKNAQFLLLNADKTKAVVLDADGKVAGWVDPTHHNNDGCESHADGVKMPTTVVSDEDGLFHFIGLDEGTYFLRETKSPAGYNILTSDVELKIIPTYDHTTQKLTNLKADVDKVQIGGNAANGSVSIVVRNSVGSSLPSTGGMGTTLFYLAGTVMVMFAGVALVTKKRVSR